MLHRRANHERCFSSHLLLALQDLLLVLLERGRLVRTQKLRARAVRTQALCRLLGRLLMNGIVVALPRAMVLLATIDAT